MRIGRYGGIVSGVGSSTPRKELPMPGTPMFKCHDGADGEYVAATRDAHLAAALMAALPEGSTVKFSGRIIWREGSEVVPAAESYDEAAEIMYGRIAANAEARRGSR